MSRLQRRLPGLQVRRPRLPRLQMRLERLRGLWWVWRLWGRWLLPLLVTLPLVVDVADQTDLGMVTEGQFKKSLVVVASAILGLVVEER